jgi:hypothetical protein
MVFQAKHAALPAVSELALANGILPFGSFDGHEYPPKKI